MSDRYLGTHTRLNPVPGYLGKLGIIKVLLNRVSWRTCMQYGPADVMYAPGMVACNPQVIQRVSEYLGTPLNRVPGYPGGLNTRGV